MRSWRAGEDFPGLLTSKSLAGSSCLSASVLHLVKKMLGKCLNFVRVLCTFGKIVRGRIIKQFAWGESGYFE